MRHRGVNERKKRDEDSEDIVNNIHRRFVSRRKIEGKVKEKERREEKGREKNKEWRKE